MRISLFNSPDLINYQSYPANHRRWYGTSGCDPFGMYQLVMDAESSHLPMVCSANAYLVANATLIDARRKGAVNSQLKMLEW